MSESRILLAMKTKGDKCELCNRMGVKLTFHHLIPRKMHGKQYIEKHFPDIDLNHYGIDVCIPCHKMIHRKIDHRSLALDFNTRDKLLAHPEIAKFVKFQSKQRKDKR